MSNLLVKTVLSSYYLMAAHPGCTQTDMAALKRFTTDKLRTTPEQVQIFTPTPATFSTLMYHTGQDPFTRKPVFVEKDPVRKQRQKAVVTTPRGPAGRKRGATSQKNGR
ncbi:MAG: DUF3362 domain-containing protein [Desulfotignum sp.]|nr:DUF3362 domain-containing protein [Desulfotignum sp.]